MVLEYALMKPETKTKLQTFALGVLAIPAVLAAMLLVVWLRKHSSLFWADLFGV